MLKVTNTLTRRKEEFIPVVPGQVRMYVCGPTVYDYPHIGHAKSYISFDVIVRYLRHLGYKVRYVQNITDVGHLTDEEHDTGEDKIEARAQRERVEPMELVERYTREYFWAMDQLNVLRPDISPRASAHIPEIIQMCLRLIEKGYAYEAEGSVYFDVTRFPGYGKLSHRRLEEQEVGVRVEVASGKRNPADFALWKKAEPGHILRWPSPWGEGYPGWHIECSVMSMKYLGETLDIHGGGVDNIFPHHEDEIAQSEALTGKTFVKYWLHNGTVTVNGIKMSKSLGNFTTIHDALKKWPAPLLRFYIVNSHYRSNLDFSERLLEDSRRGYERLQLALWNAERMLQQALGPGDPGANQELEDSLKRIEEKFYSAMNDDFNTPGAIAALFELASEMNRFISRTSGYPIEGLTKAREAFLRWSDILGLQWQKEQETGDALVPELIQLLIEVRHQARLRKDWETADHIRARLRALGIILEDHIEGGTTWRRSAV